MTQGAEANSALVASVPCDSKIFAHGRTQLFLLNLDSYHHILTMADTVSIHIGFVDDACT